MKEFKKMIAALLAAVLCLSMNFTTVFAAKETGKEDTCQIVEEGGKIYYLANGEEANEENFDVWTSKTIEETGTENEFEVTLQVGSTKKAETEDVAVMLVVDVSSSMLKNKNGKWTINSTGWKDYMPVEGPLMIDYAREGAQKLVEGLVDHAGEASIKMAMVEFGSNARTVFGWTEANENGNVNENIINSIEKLDVGFAIADEERAQCEWINTDVSFWTPSYQAADGKCLYKDNNGVTCTNTDPTHLHTAQGANVCYWVRREANFWDKTAAKCLYEGCDNTTANHKHTVEGCTYRFDNQPCTNTDPFHYHTFKLSDVDALNDTFGFNANKTMYAQRYVLTDAAGNDHLCVDYEILRQKSCGTNMEAGLLLARNLLNTGLSQGGDIEGYENTYVIMLSDGEPTWLVADYADKDSCSFVAGQISSDGKGSVTNWEDLQNIVSNGTEGDLAYAEDIKKNAAFYTIMYGYVGDKQVAADAPDYEEIKNVTIKDWLTGTNKNMVGVNDLYMAEDIETGLLDAFGNIGERIEILSKVWTVTDALSDEVAFDSFTLNGQYASYDADDHAITWHVGDMEPEKADAAGTKEDPYVYTLKYKVTLNPDYEGVYEASADNTGINTNKGANLYYIQTDGDEDLKKLSYEELKERAKDAPFEHPAVKAFYADYEFTKLLVGTEEALEGVGFTLYKDGEAWSDEVISNKNGEVKFEKISAGEYILRETRVPENMHQIAPIKFVVSYGSITTKNGDEMPDIIYNETNERVLNFYKKTEVNGTQYPLEGIEFDIYYVCSVEEYNKILNDADPANDAVFEEPTLDMVTEQDKIATVTTDAGGNASYSLSEGGNFDGIYLIVEKEHDAIEEPLAPFLIAVPMVDKDGYPVYNMNLNLKNDVVRPEVDKDVTAIDQKEDTLNVGEEVTWIIRGDIPADIAKAKFYKLTDELDYRLTYADKLVVKVEKIADEADNSTEGEDILVEKEDYILTVTEETTDVNPDENVEELEVTKTIAVELTKAGRAKIANMVGTDSADYELRVYFNTYIDEDAEMGTNIPNTVDLEYKNSANFVWNVEPEEVPVIYTCGINVYKYDAKDATKALEGAVFKLAKEVDQTTEGATPLVTKDNGTIYVVYEDFYTAIDAQTGELTAKANTVRTTSDGDAMLYGLEKDTYYLVEIQAPTGYNLLSYPVVVALNESSHLEDNTVKVANSNQFKLPETGGIGTTIFTVSGMMMLAAAVVVLVMKKKREEA